MTSAHSMLPSRLRLRARTPFALLATCVCLCACNGREKLTTPVALSAPYDRPQLWAVAPFNNESGVSLVKGDRIADAFVEQAEDIGGIAAIPVNRVLAAMKRLDMPMIGSHGDALALMNALGVDGLIVGTVMAYDPYPPLKLGAAVQLYRRDSQRAIAIDPVQVTRAASEMNTQSLQVRNNVAGDAVAQASGVYDAGNHNVLQWLDEYAAGRNEPGSAFGKRIYLASMEMYTQFVAYRLLHDLLSAERARLQPRVTPTN